jgi:hypothetical protein
MEGLGVSILGEDQFDCPSETMVEIARVLQHREVPDTRHQKHLDSVLLHGKNVSRWALSVDGNDGEIEFS